METLYKIVVILAIIAICFIATFGIPFVTEALIFALAYALVIIFFVGMAILCLDKAGLWNLPNGIVVESEADIEVQDEE